MRYVTPPPAALLLLPLLMSCTASDGDEDNVAGESARQVSAAMAKGGVPSLKPGQWASELKVSDIDVPGVAASRKAKIIARVEKDGTHDSCLSAEEAKAPPPEFFVRNAGECRYSKFAVNDGRAAITLSCDMDPASAVDMELNGSVSAGEFRFDADIAVRLPMIGKVPMKAVVNGVYKGKCVTGG